MDEPDQEDPQTNLQTLESISQWCSSINRASEDHYDYNPFASTSSVDAPIGPDGGAGWRSSVTNWLSAIDSVSDHDSDRDMSCFVTDLFDRSHGSDLEREDLAEIGGFQAEIAEEEIGEPSVEYRVGGLRIVDFDSESDGEDGDARVLGSDSVSDRFEAVLASASDEAVTGSEYFETVMESVQNFRQIMLAINRSLLNARFEWNNGESDAADSFFFDQGDNTVDFDELLEQLIETANAPIGSPPASKSAVESLVSVELKNDDVACAVCKDTILAEEKVKRLPCHHYFHGDCILPWLELRNTCPVCRYELPTDDPDYEQRKKSLRAHRGPSRIL